MARNLPELLIDASDNSRSYSGLSITTTPDLLSSLVMIMSSRRFNCSIESRSEGSMLRIVGLRPPILSNHLFRDEVQGSNKPSQSSLSLQSVRPVGERQISSPDTKPISGKRRVHRTICSAYARQHPFLCRVTLRSSFVSAHDLLIVFVSKVDHCT